MVSRVLVHSDDEHNLEDTDTNDNIEDQEDDVEQVDCEKEDTMISNDFGDTRKLSKRSQSCGEAGTSRSLGCTPKSRLIHGRLDRVCAQEVTILAVTKRSQNKQGVCRKNVENDLDFDSCITNLIEEQAEIPTFGFGVNRDNLIEEKDLTLNIGEQMIGLLHLEEMNLAKKST